MTPGAQVEASVLKKGAFYSQTVVKKDKGYVKRTRHFEEAHKELSLNFLMKKGKLSTSKRGGNDWTLNWSE